MATNILSLVTQFLTPELIGRIASALGLDRTTAQDAIGASIPAMLAGLAGLASQPGGARQLSNAMAQQRPGALDSIINAIGGSGQRALADSGSSTLMSLLGGGAMNALTGAIAKATGIGEGTSKSLLGTLAPVVLGALGQQQRAAGLDANEMVSLLASQKDQLVSALPSGVAQQLNAAGLLDQVGSGIRSGTAAAAGAAGRLSDASQQWASRATEAAHTARSAASTPQWPYWVLALAVLAGLGWLFLGPWGSDRVAEAPRTETTAPPKTVGVGVPTITVGGVDLAKQVNESVDGLKATLTGITDAASAQAALPKIREAKAQLDTVSALSERLPAEGKQSLARMVATAMPSINALIDKVLAIPGVGEVASPVINDLRGRLNSLATA